MPGASALAANAAARAGAGAVRLQAREQVAGVAAAVVQAPGDPLARLDDKRIGAVLLGPGLKADEEGRALLDAVLASGHSLVLDAGALRLLADGGPDRLEDAILTPHEGEFAALFGDGDRQQGRARAGRRREMRRGDRLQGAGHGRRGAGRPRGDRRGAALAGERRHGRRARRRDRGACAQAGWRRSRRPAPASGCMAAPPNWPGRV